MKYDYARALVESGYYQRLYRDLKRQSRRRKISRDQLELLRIVDRLPDKVPECLSQELPQHILETAHEMASLILSNLHGRWLVYDYNPPFMLLNGSYGSRQ